MKKYDPKLIESKWQKYWEKNKTFEVTEDESKKKFYGLVEFPYPSGAGLHVGHPRPFTAMDVITRKKRMEGYNVLYPMGFDAFGLPTENFAIKTGRQPAEVTAENIANFTRQLKMLGYGFDWSRVVDTTNPKYYKWTQWIFLQLFKHGLAYKKAMPINWCPSCKTGLANEEVVDGKCERCGTVVEKRNKEQWMLAITKYADKLLAGLKTVDYISQARIQQENWIGRSDGALIKFPISNLQFPINYQNSNDKNYIEVFTTRPDTLFGATYIVVAPEHPLVASLLTISNSQFPISNKKEIEEYIERTKKKTDQERADATKQKTGVELKGLKAINPANNEEIPIFVADYVLASYGTGAIMAVPAHDERDFEFAKKYNLPIKKVVAPLFTIDVGPDRVRNDKKTVYRRTAYMLIKHWSEDKYLCLNWPKFNWNSGVIGGAEGNEDIVEAGKREILEETGYKNTRLLKNYGEIHNYFFAGHKDENRYAYGYQLIFQLENDEQLSTKEADTKNHNIVWVEGKEMEKFLNMPNFLYTWKIFQGKESECFSGEGVAVNSGMLNDLQTKEAKEKMISWLEEKNIGKRKVQYKLRDWVFSRQRYWGEPIPLVYCEKCKNKKYNYIFIHAFSNNSQHAFMPWLKNKLEAQGHEVFSPDLPNTDHPKAMEQAEYILDNVKLDENTVIVTHSHGGVVALRLLEKSGQKIKKLLLVDSFIRPEFVDKKRPDVEASDNYKFDFKKIKKNCQEFIILADKNFAVIPKLQSEEMAKLFVGKLIITEPVETHFRAKEEQEVLKQLENDGWIPLPESALPLELPKVKNYEPTDTGESPLASISKWVKTKCPVCGGPARRETDTMPNWAGSSWYFLRYCDPKNDKEFASADKLKYWTPVDWYNGGMEHTVLHLLYSRFWNEFLYDIGVVPTSEPYQKRTSHGMILAPDGEKMSKSRGNVINPDEMVEKFGTDAFRTYIMFMGPFDQAVVWDTNGLVGVRRFLEKVWLLQDKVVSGKSPNFQFPISNFQSNSNDKISKSKIDTLLHQTIKKVSEDIEAMRFNTAISQLMILVNEMSKEENISLISYLLLLQLLSPFAPHLSEELWHELGNKESISKSVWPKYDPKLIIEDTITIAVQINGKLRDTFDVPTEMTEEEVKKLALSSEKVQKWLEGKEPKKVIYVKGKLVSIVI